MSEKINVGKYAFQVIDVNEQLRLAVQPELAKSVKSGAYENFIRVMDDYITDVKELPLKYKKPFRGSFLVFPQGPEFGEVVQLPLKKGMCVAPLSLDVDYPLTLMVDEKWFKQGFLSKENVLRKTGLVHELAHVVHGAYFHQMGCLSEGFAELLPHYLMNLEAQNPIHRKAVADLTESDMQTIGFINQNGMFAKEGPHDKNTQERKSYLSAYLWMRGYIDQLEKKYNLDKFGAANLLLEKFSELDRKSWDEKMDGTAVLVGISRKEMMQSLKLQKEGQKCVCCNEKTAAVKHVIKKEFSR